MALMRKEILVGQVGASAPSRRGCGIYTVEGRTGGECNTRSLTSLETW